MANTRRLLLATMLASSLFATVYSIKCYQCNSSDSGVYPFQCNDYLGDTDMVPQECTSVYGAQYCIKHIGRYEASGIKCYQCSSDVSIDCSDGLIHHGGLRPESCDHVFEARYCIKTNSLYGGIGAKRFCSSLDLGNYCNYVKQPGDTLLYRSCVYTCGTDGCNAAAGLSPLFGLLVLLPIGMLAAR